MRLRAMLFAGAALGLAGVAAWHAADVAADYLEKQEEARLTEVVTGAGEAWIRIRTDGLQVILKGDAPDEATRFRAVEIVRRTVDPDRIVDETGVAMPDPLEPPPFALELLRNETEISLIGLVPAHDAHDIATSGAIRAALAREGYTGGITDMLETADHPEPKGWAEGLAFALDVLATLPRAKISVQPGDVRVIAVTDSAEAKANLERRLRDNALEDVQLALEISAPRPVITPFRMVYVFDGKIGRFEACSAEDEASVSMIMDAAAHVGLAGAAPCQIGLGAPSPDWIVAVTAGITALGKLGGGSFALDDTRAVLTGPEGGAPEALKAVAVALGAELPATYSLEPVAPWPVAKTADGKDVASVAFQASLSVGGDVVLEGAVRDETSKQAIQSYASALFGHDKVTDEIHLDQTVPEGWPGRVIAGIDALHEIKEGNLSVTSDDLAVEGWGTSEDAQKKIELMLKERAEQVSVSVRYDADAAAAEARASELEAKSWPEICSEEIGAILQSESIVFRPGSAEIDPASQGVIAAIADVLRTCPGAQFEVAGHTDAQGRDEVNRALSTKRAEAVRLALEAQDLPLIVFRSRGYGSDQPVADNATEAGRTKNRRIELTLFTDLPDSRHADGRGGEQEVLLAPNDCADQIAEILDHESIEFAVGASEITSQSQDVINDLADTLRKCGATNFEIGGHTDSQGRADVNQRISAERAEAVRTALETAGLPDSVTLSSRGYGSDEPIADNATPEGRALNRRIEMTLLGVPEAEEPLADRSDTAANTARDVGIAASGATASAGSEEVNGAGDRAKAERTSVRAERNDGPQ